MTNEKFWELYNNGNIDTKVYEFDKERRHVEICAFEYSGMYYLRIATTYATYTLDRTAECGKKYRMGGYTNSTIKEFDNKNGANRYFKAIRAND